MISPLFCGLRPDYVPNIKLACNRSFDVAPAIILDGGRQVFRVDREEDEVTERTGVTKDV